MHMIFCTISNILNEKNDESYRHKDIQTNLRKSYIYVYILHCSLAIK